MNVSLGSTWEQYVADQVDSGTFGNASEVVRDALRRQPHARRPPLRRGAPAGDDEPARDRRRRRRRRAGGDGGASGGLAGLRQQRAERELLVGVDQPAPVFAMKGRTTDAGRIIW